MKHLSFAPRSLGQERFTLKPAMARNLMHPVVRRALHLRCDVRTAFKINIYSSRDRFSTASLCNLRTCVAIYTYTEQEEVKH